MEMILERLQRKSGKEWIVIIAPIITPLMPASIYIGGMLQASEEILHGWGWIGAFGSGIGMELVGFIASHLFYSAIRRRDATVILFGLAGLIAYAGFGAWGISQLQNAEMFMAMIAMSITAYLLIGALQYDEMAKREELAKKEQALEDRRREIALEREQAEVDALKLKAKSEAAAIVAQAEHAARELELQIEKQRTKQVKFTNTAAPVRPVREIKDEQPNTPRGRQLDAARLELVREYLKANPAASVRDVCRECNISSTDTAARYMKAA